jgi:hypothetical protein
MYGGPENAWIQYVSCDGVSISCRARIEANFRLPTTSNAWTGAPPWERETASGERDREYRTFYST